MQKLRKNTLIYSSQFCAGGLAYGELEVLWRGNTHISMLFLGGLCFCFLLYLAKTRLYFGLKCLFGGLFISVMEFFTGCVVNLWLCLGVWDYSGEACQIGGQICLRYSLLWIVLSAFVIGAYPYGKRIMASLPQLIHSMGNLFQERRTAKRHSS